MHRWKLSWVTLFEVLVAIIIFSTGILVLLSMVASNITWIKTIRLKDDATILAKEAMEMVYNLRDSNLEKWLLWYCGEFDDSASAKCGFDIYTWSAQNYIIDRTVDDTDDTMYELSTYGDDEDTRLYFHTGNYTFSGESWDLTRYNHDDTGKRTPYRRYISVSPVTGYATHTDKVLNIAVHVIAEQGIKSYDIVLESMMWDTR